MWSNAFLNRLAISISFCVSFVAVPVWGQQVGATQPISFAAPGYDISFTRPFASKEQRWTFELLGAGIGDVSNRHVAMGGLTAGVGYYFWDNVAVTLDVSGYGFNEGHSNGAATGVTLGLRHHLLSIGENSIFVDFSGGEIEASNNLPRGGTHLNNTIEVGLGLAHPLSQQMYLITGVRFFHLSNGGSEGSDRNPAINGVQGVVGFMWRF